MYYYYYFYYYYYYPSRQTPFVLTCSVGFFFVFSLCRSVIRIIDTIVFHFPLKSGPHTAVMIGRCLAIRCRLIADMSQIVLFLMEHSSEGCLRCLRHIGEIASSDRNGRKCRTGLNFFGSYGLFAMSPTDIEALCLRRQRCAFVFFAIA